MISTGREQGTTAARRIGYWSALAALATAAGYSVVQLLQLAGWLVFPWDEMLIFGFSMGIPVPFVLTMVALHHCVEPARRVWIHCAVALAIMYAVLAVIVYPVQLAVVIPVRLASAVEQVQWLRVTPGTFIWVIDGAGYILMGLSTLFAASAFAGDASATGSLWLLMRFFAKQDRIADLRRA